MKKVQTINLWSADEVISINEYNDGAFEKVIDEESTPISESDVEKLLNSDKYSITRNFWGN